MILKRTKNKMKKILELANVSSLPMYLWNVAKVRKLKADQQSSQYHLNTRLPLNLTLT